MEEEWSAGRGGNYLSEYGNVMAVMYEYIMCYTVHTFKQVILVLDMLLYCH